MNFRYSVPVFFFLLCALFSTSLYASESTSIEACASAEFPKDLMEVKDVMEIRSCYSSEDENSPEAKIDRSKFKINEDIKMCTCLRSKAVTIEDYAPMFNKAIIVEDQSDDATKLRNYTKNAHHITRKIAEKRTSLAFQASILFNANKDLSNFYKNPLADALIGNSDSRLMKMSESLSISNVDSVNKGVKQILQKLNVSLVMNNDLFIEPAFKPNQCVGFREFQAFKQLPSGSVINDLQKETFNEEDWDVETLKKKVSPKLSSDENNILKARIAFLYRNPLIKNIMSAQTSNTHGDDSLEAVVKQKLKNKQDLYNILKISSIPAVCRFSKDVEMDCDTESLDKEGLSKYKKNMQEFFSTPEIAEAVKVEAEIDLLKELKKLEEPESLTEIDLPLDHDSIMQSFKESTKKDPKTCIRSDSNIEECASILALYCQKIDSVKDRVRSGDYRAKGSRVWHPSEIASRNYFNPDIERNKEFDDFNNKICRTKRSTRPSTSGMTFQEFKRKYCVKNSRAECRVNSASNIRKIRTLYLKEYDKNNSFNKHVLTDPTEDLTKEDVNVLADKTRIPKIDWSKQTSLFGGNSQKYGANAIPNISNAASKADISQVNGGSNNIVKDVKNDNAIIDPLINYANVPLPGPDRKDVPKVQELSDEERQEVLNDWKSDLSDLNKKEKNPEILKSEKAMKEKIALLEELLSEQKKLSDEQLKLLNDSLAARKANDTPAIAKEVAVARKKFKNQIVPPEFDASSNTGRQRGPASSKENSQSAGNNSNSSSFGGASTRGRTPGSNTLSDTSNKDSVLREQAKLVNLRENSNGSITVSSGEGASSNANAISVNVSDSLYLSAQANPVGLNLSQIAQNIPKDQIEKLNAKGDYFIILLQNGSHPPLEVKVKKDMNGLIQLDGSQIIQRRVSLDGLRNTLK